MNKGLFYVKHLSSRKWNLIFSVCDDETDERQRIRQGGDLGILGRIFAKDREDILYFLDSLSGL